MRQQDKIIVFEGVIIGLLFWELLVWVAYLAN